MSRRYLDHLALGPVLLVGACTTATLPPGADAPSMLADGPPAFVDHLLPQDLPAADQHQPVPDGGADLGSDLGADQCVALTCEGAGKNCGAMPDGCGATLTCGTCTPPETCGGGGTANVCGTGPCTPTTCAAQGKDCGSISDGCSTTLTCGTCTPPETCGGGGTANVCGCTPTTCAAQGKDCGSISDGCSATLTCGTCTAPAYCGGGGTANVCGTPVVCATGVAGQGGCTHIGGAGLQQAITTLPAGTAALPTPIAMRAGTYTCATAATLGNQHCFVAVDGKHLQLDGPAQGYAHLDGANSAPATAICVASGSAKITRLQASGFKSAGDCATAPPCAEGHGVRAWGDAQVTISDSVLQDNARSGITAVERAQLTVTRNRLLRNQDNGLHAAGSTKVDLINNTFDANRTAAVNLNQCGADNPTTVVVNNIFTNTKKKTDDTFGFGLGGSCLLQGDLSDDLIAHNLTFNNEGDSSPCGGFDDAQLCAFPGVLKVDPQYNDPAAGDYTLKPTSPAKQAGIPNTGGGSFDLGAFDGPATSWIWPAPVVSLQPFTSLSQQHSGCTAANPFSLDCMAASSRWCKTQGHTSGWGGVEFGAAELVVVCTTEGAQLDSVPASSLTAQHSGCTAAAIFSMSCNAAIHRYCRAQGYVSGVGPVEFTGTHVSIVCVKRAFERSSSYANLSLYHASCDDVAEAHAPACRAAVQRYCRAHAHRAGFGPVETSATDAIVACLP